MKKIILISLLFVAQLNSNAQSWQWLSTIGGGGSVGQDHPDEQVFDIKVDPDGNVYTCGKVLNGAMISDTIPMTLYGGYDIFIAKYNCHGDLLWYNTAGSSFSGDEATGLLLDANNNIYLTGRVESSVTFGRCNFFGHMLGDLYDMFICKFNSSGNLVWYNVGGNANYQGGSEAREIKFDKDSNLAVMYFISNPGILFPGFIAQQGLCIGTFSPLTGTMIKNFSLSTFNPFYRGFAIDKNNNYTVLGALVTDSVLINNQPIYHYYSDKGIPELFVYQVDSLGSTKWIRHFGDSLVLHDLDAGGIISDTLGNLYISGTTDNGSNLDGHIAFNPGNSMFPFAAFPFLAKLDSNGTVIWLTNPSIQTSSEGRHGLCLMKSGHILFTGIYGGLGIFGDSTFTSQVPFDMFLSEVNDSGIVLNGENFSTIGFNEQINAITVDDMDQIYVAGAFDGTLTLGNHTKTMVGGNGDGFIAKLGNICTTGINEISNNAGILLYPNPANDEIRILGQNQDFISYQIYNLSGLLMGKDLSPSNSYKINVSHFAQGMYFIVLSTNKGKVVKKFSKM